MTASRECTHDQSCRLDHVSPPPLDPDLFPLAEDTLAAEPPPPPSMLNAALAHAAKGIKVLPVWSVRAGRCACGQYPCGKNNEGAGKHPLTRLVLHGVTE